MTTHINGFVIGRVNLLVSVNTAEAVALKQHLTGYYPYLAFAIDEPKYGITTLYLPEDKPLTEKGINDLLDRCSWFHSGWMYKTATE